MIYDVLEGAGSARNIYIYTREFGGECTTMSTQYEVYIRDLDTLMNLGVVNPDPLRLCWQWRTHDRMYCRHPPYGKLHMGYAQ